MRAILAVLFKRFLPGAVAFALGIGVLLGAGNAAQMLLGFLFFLVASIFVAGPIAQWLAAPMGSLFWPRKYYARPQPMYGIPQARRAKGQLEEALAEYENIAAAHPDEVRPWLDMIDLAVHDLKDARRANAIFQTGIARLNKPADQDALAQVYAEVLTRLDVRPQRPPLHIHPE